MLEPPLVSSLPALAAGETRQVTLERLVVNPRKWTAETPNLYTLTLELVDAEGRVIEVVATRVGFREIEVRNQAILVNGVAVKLNGVNSHILHPRGGSRVDVDTLRRDLVLMKQFNVNTVRTSHYPPNVEYLDLADELGVYVVDEVGDESHATEFVSKDPSWRDAYLHRVRKLVHRDRNHPSVLIWSAGNESGSGENIAAVIEEGKRIDPTRPAWCYGGNEDLLPFEDIVGPRYPTIEDLAKVAAVPATVDPRPSFMDEYLAATGTSVGQLDEFWQLIWKHPRLTGGAVWDWISPGMLARWRPTPDLSPNHVEASLMAGASLVTGRFGRGVSLSGFDQWIEVQRHPGLDLIGNQLTASVWVYPRAWNGDGSYLTKGNGQFGLVQRDAATIEFYVTASARAVASAPVPRDWVGRWHQVAGIYDGRTVRLVVDGAVLDTKPCEGPLTRTADPVNVGRVAGVHGQEHPGRISNAVFDRVRIFPRALAVADLDKPASELAAQAALWLELDEVAEGPEYYSLGIGARDYGLVWPDRRPQAELWQLKKSPQPVLVEAIDARRGRVASHQSARLHGSSLSCARCGNSATTRRWWPRALFRSRSHRGGAVISRSPWGRRRPPRGRSGGCSSASVSPGIRPGHRRATKWRGSSSTWGRARRRRFRHGQVVCPCAKTQALSSWMAMTSPTASTARPARWPPCAWVAASCWSAGRGPRCGARRSGTRPSASGEASPS